MIYEPGQVKSIFPYVAEDIKAFVLGGPADGDEAQLFHEQFPSVAIYGFEPNLDYYRHQLAVGFPGKLEQAALSDELSENDFYLLGEGAGRSSRLAAEHAPAYRVKTLTIDSLGLDVPMALWLDIERSELKALEGAVCTFAAGLVRVVLLEILPDAEKPILEFLDRYDMVEAARVNCHDEYDDAGRTVAYRYDGIYVNK